MSKKFDLVGAIISLESGELDEESVIETYQHLINTGVIHGLQGSHQRTAQQLIAAGLCTAQPRRSKSRKAEKREARERRQAYKFKQSRLEEPE